MNTFGYNNLFINLKEHNLGDDIKKINLTFLSHSGIK